MSGPEADSMGGNPEPGPGGAPRAAIDPAEHLGLVGLVVNERAARVGADRDLRDDMEGVARVALVRAARKFDPAMGFAFGTYAGVAIRRAVDEFLAGPRHLVRPPHRLPQDPESLARARAAIRRPVSLEALGEPERYCRGLVYRDQPDDESDRYRSGLLATLMRRTALTPRESAVIRARYSACPPTQRAIGRRYGVSKQQVSLDEAAATRKLRAAAARIGAEP